VSGLLVLALLAGTAGAATHDPQAPTHVADQVA